MHPQDPRRAPSHPEHTHATPGTVGHIGPGLHKPAGADRTGSGSGGPGYKFASENLSGARYTSGTVAMANAGPGTNGSQFFLVYRDSLSLHPDYTPFGTVVKGLGIIQNVAKAGTDNANGPGDGHPKERVVIERVIIKKT